MTPDEIEKKCEELTKVKHNGVVRIRFQASYFDEMTQQWHIAVAHSTPVHDQSTYMLFYLSLQNVCLFGVCGLLKFHSIVYL